MNNEFEWDTDKAASNLRKHGVAFEDAQLVFSDVFALDSVDVDAGYGEIRMVITGMAKGRLLTVVYTERGERTRIITARKGTRHEQRDYYRSQTPP
jgi:uncharacterized DUF497 family protein